MTPKNRFWLIARVNESAPSAQHGFLVYVLIWWPPMKATCCLSSYDYFYQFLFHTGNQIVEWFDFIFKAGGCFVEPTSWEVCLHEKYFSLPVRFILLSLEHIRLFSRWNPPLYTKHQTRITRQNFYVFEYLVHCPVKRSVPRMPVWL